MRLLVSLLMFASLSLTGGALGAQPGPGGPGPRGMGGGDTMALRQRVRERVKTMFIWKITEGLSLDEAAAQRVFPVFNRYDEKLRPLRASQAELFGRLRTEIESGKPDVQRLTQSIDTLAQNRRQIQAIEEERWRDLRKVLTPVQQAKLVLMLPRLEADLRRQVRQAMNMPQEEDWH